MHNLNFTAIAIAWLGSSLVALPLLAFTARYGLVPLVESVAVARAAGQAPRSTAALERRIALLERGFATLNGGGRITDASDGIDEDVMPVVAAVSSSIEAGVDGGHPAY